jgi:superfamily II DNA or RNA helicase
VVEELRPYQRACLHAIWRAYRAGMRRQLVSLPTGTGKTVIFAQFPRFFAMRRRMLVLAHREELLEQAADKIRRANPALAVDIEQAERHARHESQVVVASVATIGRAGAARLAALDPAAFRLVVIDEAHHATASSYRRVLEHLGVFAPGSPTLVVGFTATPRRGDGAGLDAVFEEIVFSRTLPEMVAAGFLAPVAGFRVETNVDLSRVRTRAGDFVPAQLSRAVNVEARNELVVRVQRDLLAGRPTLCFCVDVAHAHALAEAFVRVGVPAAAVTGEMEPAVRRQRLAAFAAGELAVLTNCMVLTEGWDESRVAGVILARPTRSTLLYTQMIGRGTRLHPGKADVRVVDIVDATQEHALVTLPSLFGLAPGFDLEGRTVLEVRRALAWVERHRPWVRADLARSLTDLRYRCRKVALMELELPLALRGEATLAWTAVGRDTYRLALGRGESLSVAPTILGAWELALRGPGSERLLVRTRGLPAAIAAGERFVREERAAAVPLVRCNSHWRRRPASPRQLAYLARRGLAVPEGLTRGQASHLIAMLGDGRGARGG